jgi:RNA polymerase sigma-70 factor (ECF subfamily)
MTASVATSFDEENLVKAAKRGNLDAFNELILYYQNQIYNLAYHLMKDPAAADDATQEAFISAYRHLDQFRGGSFRAWILRIVTNACYDEMRRYKRRPAISFDDFGDMDKEANPHLRDKAELPEETLERAELREVLEATMERLPEEQRMTLFLVDRLGLSYEETADAMETELGTVKSRLYRARAKMRDYLQENMELLPPRYRLKGKD